MRRREFIGFLSGAAAWPLGARARGELGCCSSLLKPTRKQLKTVRRF
jgi:hypothetical protein